ncbi:MAG TPA: UbiA prenyltransferase family protein [Gaiellaceae bacterium]|nr:UbiA prenyltransferase family protein [Gaiellaceae bacterium]
MTAAAIAVTALGRTGAALVEAMRPRQWIKNLLLFAGLVFAGVVNQPVRWADAIAAFGIFCVLSSGAYLLNDARDAASDRLHPAKRFRPVARGAISPELALAASALMVAGGLAAAAALAHQVLEFAVAFTVLQFAYTLVLKRAALLDVLAIAALFVIRAAAGAEAVEVHISSWLLACTALLALFLGLAKRRGELVSAGRGETPGRSALRGYSLPVVNGLLTATLAGTFVTYSTYAFYSPDTQWMTATIPFVAAGLARYLWLVRHDDLGEEPETVLLTDRLLLACVGLWVIVAAAVVIAAT